MQDTCSAMLLPFCNLIAEFSLSLSVEPFSLHVRCTSAYGLFLEEFLWLCSKTQVFSCSATGEVDANYALGGEE